MAAHGSARPALWVAALALALGGCAFVDEAVLPMARGEFVPPLAPAQTASVALAPAVAQPLLIIRFGDTAPDFQAALQQALDETLVRRPAATFWVVALAPAAGDPEANRIRARGHLQTVLDGMVAAGLAEERIGATVVTSAQTTLDEVQVFAR